ncbi:MAG: ABC transporter transmembrane domain-containing protein [Gemmatimonadales bacterium]|nr:ABC transporter transmembrane domain-containing protein [Gemmatimonadales bacterium]MDZ4390751.1 ABC transporter transmembrane domain-containing protein [Gemmatimonadales bacterium]
MATVALLLSSTLALAFPLVVRYLLDAAFVDGNREVLDRIAIGLLLIFATTAVLNYVQTYWLSATGERAVAGLRRELFAKLLTMPPGFFADRRTGELTSRLTTDIGLLQGILSHQIAEASRQLLALVGGVTILTLMQPVLMLTALGVMPVVVGSAMLFGKRLKRMTTSLQDEVAESTGLAEEAFSQIRVVQGFAQEPYERARYGARISEVIAVALHRARVRAMFFGAITFTTFAGVTAVLWMGGRLVLAGSLTPGSLVSFLLYTVSIAAAIGALAAFFSAYQEAIGAARRVFELLETEPTIRDAPDAISLPTPVQGEVVFDDVTFRYHADGDNGVPTLDQISFRIAPGEVVALVGPSGSGKTTIASLLPRFWDVDTGRITLDGHDVRSLRLADLRRTVGVVPQEPALFSGTVCENIAYAHPEASEAEVMAAAQVANAHDFIMALPQGYGTRVGERGVKLSGGQRQRIAIARAVLKNPAVLILDEATSALDNESEHLVEVALERLLVGRSTLIIAHRLSTVQRADRLIVLDRGRIIEEGNHAELLRRGGVYARLFQLQFRGDDDVAAALEVAR